MAWQKLKVQQPVSPRVPDEKSATTWLQREVHALLGQLRIVVNWAVDWLGKVGIDATDTPGGLETKLLGSSTITLTKSGAEGARVITATATGGALDDHLVKASDSDATAVGGLVQKTKAGSNITLTEVTDVGVKKLQISASSPDPVAEGSYLYTALVEDPLEHLACRALSVSDDGSGLAWYGLTLSYGWTQIDGVSTWRKSTGLPVLAFVALGSHVPLAVGDRFYVANEGGLSSQSKYNGIYELLEQGDSVSTYAVIRRVADANTIAELVTGMACQITGTGVAHEGDWVVLANDCAEVDVTALTFDFESSFSPALTYGLLTPAQLVSEGASTETAESYSTVESAAEPGGIQMNPAHDTLAGTPNLAEVPAGRFALRVKYRRATDAADTTRMEYRLYTQTVGGTPDLPAFLSLWSPPLHATTDTVLEWEADLAAVVATTPEKQIVGRMYLHTDGASPVTIYWTWNDADRSTRLRTPWQNPVNGGTNWHPDLLGRSELEQHPPSAVGIYQRVLADDWVSTADELQDVTGFEIPVKAGVSYRIEAQLYGSAVTGQGGAAGGIDVSIAGTATVGSCLLLHECVYWGGAAWAVAHTRTATFGDGGSVNSAEAVVDWKVTGVLHVTADGVIRVRANTGAGTYGEAAFLLLDSFFELKEVR